ncbi:MAG: hypothetical protein K0R51_2775 [Cytophagaceae bacterium]|jgi:hypothetical protein|nr:hypothetical protein [Cytophagaceae bacterium]
MKRIIIPVIFIFNIFSSSSLYAQISAQGQGGKDVIWLAAGVEQQLGMRWTNKNAVAYSRHSDLNNWNATQQSGVFTVREELVYRLSKHVKISQGIFYAERSYYDAEHPEYINEIRCYPKVYHEFNIQQIKFSQYLRMDIRFFSAPGFKPYNKPLEIRNRYLMKVYVPLDNKHKNHLVGMTEFFFATDKKRDGDGSTFFTPYQFTENRSCVYFRHHLTKPDAFFDAGIMVQSWKDESQDRFRETYILQLDFILINPFGRRK